MQGKHPAAAADGGAAALQPAPQFGRESADDSTRATQLTAEARTPAAHLTIVQQPDSVSISDDQGLIRTFHPDGRREELTLGTVPLPTRARWTAGGLEVVYDVESGWQLRYRYTPSADRKQLVVDIRFVQQGHEGDEVRLTYEPPGAHERAVLGGASSSTTRNRSGGECDSKCEATDSHGRGPPYGVQVSTTVGTVVHATCHCTSSSAVRRSTGSFATDGLAADAMCVGIVGTGRVDPIRGHMRSRI